ncbi:MAG TPA: hypothetical protein VK703_15370 [Candidatus Acidoferrales bacterium]|jgi:hypothetical protein|nr:hypothetical protein [Candidatus Acidoferrales bacterium]
MRRFLLLAVVCLASVPCLKAQEDGRFQVGAFADYFRSVATGTNMFGLGGRLGVGILPHTMLEGEMAYDFNRAFVDAFTYSTGGSVSYITSGVRTLHAMVGPRVTWEHGPIHPFAELKAGFINYDFSNVPTGYTSYSNQIQNLRNQDVNGAILAGGGLEGKVGPIGMRMDVGDEMYFNHGAHQGLKVSAGPYIRF